MPKYFCTIIKKSFLFIKKKESYPQKLNEFNTRDKYFSGVNRIKTTVWMLSF